MSSVDKDLFSRVNTVSDPNNLTDLERKHLPILTAPGKVKAGKEFEVTVEVGKLMPHPNDHDHYISFVQLYVGDLYLARLDLVPGRTWPVMKVKVTLEEDLGPLRGFEFCNIHGTWESRQPLVVE